MGTPKCPKCGKPMKIETVGNFRQYQCSSNSILNPKYCWGSIDIDPKKILSMTEISNNLAINPFTRSDERRKEQTSLKRTETGLQQCEDRYKRFLSEKEIKSLHAAQAIVSKYRTAVEKSKNIAVQIEKKEKLENERLHRKQLIEKADKFLNGLNQDEALLKCETFDQFANGKRNSTLRDRIYFFKKNPQTSQFNSLKIEIAKELEWADLDHDPIELKKFETFEKEFLKNRKIEEKRKTFRIIETE